MLPTLPFLALVAILLSACQQPGIRDPASPFFAIPDGSLLRVNEPIVIPAEQAHVYIQNGSSRNLNGTFLYAPNCKLWVKDISATPQTVQPGIFRIRKVRKYVDTLMLVGQPQLLASAGLLASGSGGGDGGPTDYMYVTELVLESAEQPLVRKLICQQLDDPGLGEHVSFDEMAQTLGGIASIDIRREP